MVLQISLRPIDQPVMEIALEAYKAYRGYQSESASFPPYTYGWSCAEKRCAHTRFSCEYFLSKRADEAALAVLMRSSSAPVRSAGERKSQTIEKLIDFVREEWQAADALVSYDIAHLTEVQMASDESDSAIKRFVLRSSRVPGLDDAHVSTATHTYLAWLYEDHWFPRFPSFPTQESEYSDHAQTSHMSSEDCPFLSKIKEIDARATEIIALYRSRPREEAS